MTHTVNKGKGFERDIRRALLDAGFPARRTPRSGATDFAKGDVQFAGRVGRNTWSEGGRAEVAAVMADSKTFWDEYSNIRTIECKRKKKLPSWLTECLEHDVVALREDRGETVIVMGLETFLELMK